MFVSSRILHLASRSRRGSSVVQKMTTSRPFSSHATIPNDIPHGISVEVLTKMHSLSQIRRLLVKGFVLNHEPVIQGLCERHYPTLSTSQRLLKVEKKFRKLHTDRFLMEKIEEGLSVVVVKDIDPVEYLCVLFAETYKGNVYKNVPRINDRFCKEALALMDAVHTKAAPFLTRYDPKRIAFLSHACTLPDYRSMGIMEANMELVFSRLTEKGFKLAYCQTTAERTSMFVTNQFNFHAIAEVMYKDYEYSGEQLFANVPEIYPSVKAMVKFI